jgi:flagellin
VQTAEGALTETTAILQRMRDLAVQASNSGSQDTTARTAANSEVKQLASELDRIATTTSFNGVNLLDGTYDATKAVFQVGAKAGETITFKVDSGAAGKGFKATDLAVDANAGTPDIDLVGGASAAITKIDAAIGKVSASRADLGAVQNRFEHTINNLSVAVENLSASESRIRDTDMAQEMVSYTRAQILSQAGTAMLAQANQAPQSVLQLLK